ncbi:MAG TPA: YfcE family phosphodiesterase [Phycisphaerae bacterium]|nr:YfcE family phosphodiesterase [Phycisphaerae bacterium]HOJ72822.1 YfcE family phosphodiesterase [Phycisphaerae bacterium]HOM51751.1 YfcE family phosphodiesterase [Phycisphaerae bacterium]HON65001.1 YfcE family phosphodiesterase [Phycisphaerae bacterium]HPU25419.1 YfcE family phosphodiesterase [Phycisphaerae bacterium]
MKLGIMSDSHGRVGRVRDALAILDAAGAEAIVHCGDVGGIEVLEELAGRRCWFVWGNTDYPHPTWRASVEALGLPWPDGPVEFTAAGRRIAVYHGHEPGFEGAIRSGRSEYLLHGHSHRKADYRVGPTRVINPGALHRVGVPTVAILDVQSDDLSFLEV